MVLNVFMKFLDLELKMIVKQSFVAPPDRPVRQIPYCLHVVGRLFQYQHAALFVAYCLAR